MCYKCTEEYISDRWAKEFAKFIDQEILEDIIKKMEDECVGWECVYEHCPKHGLKWKLKNQLYDYLFSGGILNLKFL